MPIYEYKCPTCGVEVAKLVKMDAPPPECETCAGNPEVTEPVVMAKKISKTGFKLEGGGWANDGYG